MLNYLIIINLSFTFWTVLLSFNIYCDTNINANINTNQQNLTTTNNNNDNKSVTNNKKLRACIMVIQHRLEKDSKFFEEVKIHAKVEQYSNEEVNEKIVQYLLSNCVVEIKIEHADEVL